MAATPYTGTVFARTLATGEPYPLRIGGDDVANDYVNWTDDSATAQSFIVPVSTGGLYVEDIQLNAAGVDTTALRFVVDNLSKRVVMQMATLADPKASPSARVPPGVRIAPGARLQLQELA